MAVRKADVRQGDLLGAMAEAALAPMLPVPPATLEACKAASKMANAVMVELLPERRPDGRTHPCAVCKLHAFAWPNVTCYWCGKRALDADGSAP